MHPHNTSMPGYPDLRVTLVISTGTGRDGSHRTRVEQELGKVIPLRRYATAAGDSVMMPRLMVWGYSQVGKNGAVLSPMLVVKN